MSKYRKYIDNILKEKLGPLYIGIPSLYKVFFREVEGLKVVNVAVFKKCKEGDNLLYTKKGGWRGWPKSIKESKVLEWFDKLIKSLLNFIKGYRFAPKI